MKFFAVLALIAAVNVDQAPESEKMLDVDLNDVMEKMTPEQMEDMLNSEAAQLPEDDAEEELPEDEGDDLAELDEEDEAPVEDEELETPEQDDDAAATQAVEELEKTPEAPAKPEQQEEAEENETPDLEE